MASQNPQIMPVFGFGIGFADNGSRNSIVLLEELIDLLRGYAPLPMGAIKRMDNE